MLKRILCYGRISSVIFICTNTIREGDYSVVFANRENKPALVLLANCIVSIIILIILISAVDISILYNIFEIRKVRQWHPVEG